MPVVAPLGLDADGTILNVNADDSAAAIATALAADELMFLSDVPGVLDEQGAVLSQISASHPPASASGGMLPKLEACTAALLGGVARVQDRHRRHGGDAMSLRDRAEAAILPTYPERPLALVRGVGCTVWDEDGNAYLDLVGGLAVNSLGYGHPAAVQALAEQAAVLGHVSNLFYSEPMVALAERLCALSGQDRAFFCNSGAEAVEAAIKLARRVGRARGGPAKHRIVCVEGAFHGRTLATLAAGWSAAKREPFEPVPAGFEHVARNDLEALAAAVGPETCAVLVEPIQGEGGVWTIDADWLRLARELCDRHGALLLYDEVQTGIGRCGVWFCAELAGVRPDAIAVAKGLAGGLPIGALLATRSARRRLRARRSRDDVRRLARRSRPRRWPCWPRSSARTWSRTPARSASTSRARAAALPGVDHVRGAGPAAGNRALRRTGRARSPRRCARAASSSTRSRPRALRLVPPLCLSQVEADRFCAAFEDVLAARRDQHATTVA